MLKNFLPDEHVKSILDINPEELKERGIKGIITDLDNTLVEWDRPNATPELIKWFEQIKNIIYSLPLFLIIMKCVLRNSLILYKFRLFFERGNRWCVHLIRLFLKWELKKEEAVVIGDQLLTDVFGGNRSGFHTILVVPVAQTDGFFTKFNRFTERRILNWFRKKGMIQWED